MIEVRIWFVTQNGQRRSVEARVKCLEQLKREVGEANVEVVADPASEPDLKNLSRYWVDGIYVGEKGA
jgi:hypothetical protein